MPLDLGIIGMPRCRLCASADLPFVTLAVANGIATWDIAIPNDATQDNGTLYLQGMVLEPGVKAFGAIVTNAVKGRMGN